MLMTASPVAYLNPASIAAIWPKFRVKVMAFTRESRSADDDQAVATEGDDLLPHYTNVQMPFPGFPPEVPDDNPTGVYERDVEIPRAWAGKRIVLHVGAAESAGSIATDRLLSCDPGW